MNRNLWITCILVFGVVSACKEESGEPEAEKPAVAASAKDGLTPPVVKAKPAEPKRSTIEVEGAELTVRDVGEGSAVLFIHGSVFRDGLVALASEPSFTSSHRVISYERRGFGGRSTGPASMSVQAADAAAVLKSLGVAKAHVVGHSFGANIALELAKEHKDMVASLTLLEPVILEVPSAEANSKAMGPMFGAYGKGDKSTALSMFLTSMSGPKYKEFIDSKMPEGAYDLALKDIDTLFQVEFPALMGWKFVTEKSYEGLTMPVLFLSGSNTSPSMKEGGDVVAKWFPQLKRGEIADADHMFAVSKSAEAATEISSFIAAAK